LSSNSINSGVACDEMLFKIKSSLKNYESVMELDPNVKVKLAACGSMHIYAQNRQISTNTLFFLTGLPLEKKLWTFQFFLVKRICLITGSVIKLSMIFLCSSSGIS
jgi:hypothetical protein